MVEGTLRWTFTHFQCLQTESLGILKRILNRESNMKLLVGRVPDSWFSGKRANVTSHAIYMRKFSLCVEFNCVQCIWNDTGRGRIDFLREHLPTGFSSVGVILDMNWFVSEREGKGNGWTPNQVEVRVKCYHWTPVLFLHFRYLQENNISSIEPDTFKNLSNLKVL